MKNLICYFDPSTGRAYWKRVNSWDGPSALVFWQCAWVPSSLTTRKYPCVLSVLQKDRPAVGSSGWLISQFQYIIGFNVQVALGSDKVDSYHSSGGTQESQRGVGVCGTVGWAAQVPDFQIQLAVSTWEGSLTSAWCLGPCRPTWEIWIAFAWAPGFRLALAWATVGIWDINQRVGDSRSTCSFTFQIISRSIYLKNKIGTYIVKPCDRFQ